MKVLHGLMLVGLMALMTGCAGNSPDQMISSAKDLDRRFTEAFSKGDVDGVSACYLNSPETVLYPPDYMEQVGWPAIHEGFAKFLPGGHAKLELIEPQYRVCGDCVVARGKFKVTMPQAGGSGEMYGRFMELIVERDGKWYYLWDHPSVPMPPMGPSPTPAPGK